MWYDMTLRSSSISLDEYDSKIRKVSRCRPTVSNETILATGQGFFFTKVAPAQSITDIVLFDFWLMLFSWKFTSSYTTIYFFVKAFIYLNVYISVNTIFECLYMFFGWERGHQLNIWTQLVGKSKTHTAAYKGKRCLASCLRTSLFIFLAEFLSYCI